MKDIITGFCLLFCVPTCINYWLEVFSKNKKEDEEMERKWWSCE